MSTTDLDKLLELARTKTVTAAERETQRLSFAYGNTKMANEHITRESIKKAAEELAAQPVTITKK